ncbi:MAG: ABC transporter ATP-binding protein [Armatimonadota bacterium]
MAEVIVPEAIVAVENLTKVYGLGSVEVAALAGVDLKISRGEFVAIMGPSGSGKTTFMNIIGCLDRPTTGSYKLSGQAVEKLSDDRLAEIRNKHIGFVFQSFNLLQQHTALQNVELPLLYAGVTDRKDRALASLDRVRMSDRAYHKPSEMSGGQQQRVAIARALVTNPSMILADEPTGALDSHTGAEIMELFENLNEQGITLITVTHDARVGERARRLVRFLDGEIVSDDAVSTAGQEDQIE